MRDHRLIDQRSLAFGRAVAARLAVHPEIAEVAKKNLERWLKTCAIQSCPALLEWSAALNGSIEEVVALLTSGDERATRLRQSNPFAGILSQSERNAILLQFQAYDASRA